MKLTKLYSASYNQIRLNRLEGRILSELSSNPSKKNKYIQLFEQIETRYKNHLNRTLEQIKAIEEIQACFSDKNKPISIKGFTAALLCDDPQKFRFSGDIDLFFDDINLLKNILLKLNYEQIHKTPAPHEDSFYRKGNVIIEIHKYYPILMAPSIPHEMLLRKKQTNLPDIQITKLEYQSLLAHSQKINNPSVGSLLITDIEMTIFLLCAHTYKDLFWQPYNIPRVRSVELIEICDLMNLPNFNLEKLITLAQQMNAIHILQYVFAIIENAFCMPIPEKLKFIGKPIIKLMNDTYSPYKMVDTTYFSMLPFLTFSQTIDFVGSSDCFLDTKYHSQYIDTTYYASTTQTTIDYSFSAYILNDKICYQIELNRPIENGDNICIMIDNGIFTHIWFDELPDKLRVYGIDDYDISENSSSYSVAFRFDKPSILPTKAVIAVGNSNHDSKMVTVNPVSFSLPNH